jgi:hypothetical protein
MNRSLRLGFCALGSLLIGLSPGRADEPAAPRAVASVGMQARLSSVVLPGPELEVKPLEDRRAPLVLRIVGFYPHGTEMRYDFVFYGLEPGSYDLGTYVRRKDGSALGALPPIPVRVDAVLPPGQIEPHALGLLPAPWMGGYRLVLALAGSLWCAGFVAILLWGRGKRGRAEEASAQPLTLADRLAPLVNAAMEGTLSPGQHAELERLLIGYWRRRLQLDHASPAQAMRAMKEHPEAGPLLRRLEDWLHRPGPRTGAVDVAALLAPYRSLEAEPEGLPTPESPPSRVPAPAPGGPR